VLVGAHVRGFEFFGGCPQLVIPDNTKTGVNRACRYDLDLNPTYQKMAAHYGVGVLPTRPYRARDIVAGLVRDTRPCFFDFAPGLVPTQYEIERNRHPLCIQRYGRGGFCSTSIPSPH
jgi:hypothetical protein